MHDKGCVSVVIPVWNLWEMTEACLRSLAEHSAGENMQVVVVDNHSTDATATELAPLGESLFGASFKAVRMPENVGFARGCNAGAQAADGDLLFFLNNDTTLSPRWLPPLREAMADPRLGAVGPLLLYPNGTVQHCGIYVTPFNTVGHLYEHLPGTFAAARNNHPLQAITGAAIMLRKVDFEACGAFHEAYRNGFEDIDLCFALRARGFKLRVEARSVICHHTSCTPGRFAHDVENSAVLMQRIGGALRPDEHMLVSLDGYCLHIGPSLTTWVELPDERQRRLNEEFGHAAFDSAACQAMLHREPLWLDGWLLLAGHHAAGGDLSAAMDSLNRCLRIMPSPKVYGQLLKLARSVNLSEDILVDLEAERVGRDKAVAKIRVQQARRAAYTRGDAALAQLLGDWLVQYAS